MHSHSSKANNSELFVCCGAVLKYYRKRITAKTVAVENMHWKYNKSSFM